MDTTADSVPSSEPETESDASSSSLFDSEDEVVPGMDEKSNNEKVEEEEEEEDGHIILVESRDTSPLQEQPFSSTITAPVATSLAPLQDSSSSSGGDVTSSEEEAEEAEEVDASGTEAASTSESEGEDGGEPIVLIESRSPSPVRPSSSPPIRQEDATAIMPAKMKSPMEEQEREEQEEKEEKTGGVPIVAGDSAVTAKHDVMAVVPRNAPRTPARSLVLGGAAVVGEGLYAAVTPRALRMRPPPLPPKLENADNGGSSNNIGTGGGGGNHNGNSSSGLQLFRRKARNFVERARRSVRSRSSSSRNSSGRLYQKETDVSDGAGGMITIENVKEEQEQEVKQEQEQEVKQEQEQEVKDKDKEMEMAIAEPNGKMRRPLSAVNMPLPPIPGPTTSLPLAASAGPMSSNLKEETGGGGGGEEEKQGLEKEENEEEAKEAEGLVSATANSRFQLSSFKSRPPPRPSSASLASITSSMSNSSLLFARRGSNRVSLLLGRRESNSSIGSGGGGGASAVAGSSSPSWMRDDAAIRSSFSLPDGDIVIKPLPRMQQHSNRLDNQGQHQYHFSSLKSLSLSSPPMSPGPQSSARPSVLGGTPTSLMRLVEGVTVDASHADSGSREGAPGASVSPISSTSAGLPAALAPVSSPPPLSLEAGSGAAQTRWQRWRQQRRQRKRNRSPSSDEEAGVTTASSFGGATSGQSPNKRERRSGSRRRDRFRKSLDRVRDLFRRRSSAEGSASDGEQGGGGSFGPPSRPAPTLRLPSTVSDLGKGESMLVLRELTAQEEEGEQEETAAAGAGDSELFESSI
eukprot:UC1_evm2s1317